jgi:glucokinase
VTDRVAVLEVGGTHVSAAWVDRDGWQVEQVSRAELDPAADAERLLAGLAAAGARLAAPAGTAWGMAMPGPFDYAGGVAHYTGVGKFEGLAGVDVRSALYERLPEQPGSISFVNDASAFLIGEWLIGTARGATRCAAVTLGTGIGSAFLDRGRVVDSGPDVPPQAEVHLLTHAGSPLEDWVSRRALRRDYAARAGLPRDDAARAGLPRDDAARAALPRDDAARAALPDDDAARAALSRDDAARAGRPDDTDVREIAALARNGDPAAAATFEGAFLVLGEVLGPWLERFGADQLVIGGSIAGAWDLIARPLRTGLARYSECRYAIGLAAEPERSPLVGAAHVAS